MRRRRVFTLALATVFALAVFVGPAAAQSINRELFDELNTQLLYVGLPLAVFVEIILIYAVVKFRNNPDPKPTIADPPLEVTWTIATGVILLFVGFSSYAVLGSPYMSPVSDAQANTNQAESIPPDAVVVEAVSYQYAWEFHYPESNVTTRGKLVVPLNQDVYIRLTSQDVIHSLFIPDLGVKQDAFPGQHTLVQMNVFKPGVYQAYCAELCGAGHSRMRADAIAVSPQKYDSWLSTHANQSGVTETPTPANSTTATPA